MILLPLKGICLGDLFINVDTNSYRYGLRIFGVSNFNFDYGFSVYENNCRKTMDKRPIMSKKKIRMMEKFNFY